MNKLIIFISLLLLLSCSKEDDIINLKETYWFTYTVDSTGVKETKYLFINDSILKVYHATYSSKINFNFEIHDKRDISIFKYTIDKHNLIIEDINYLFVCYDDKLLIENNEFSITLTNKRKVFEND